jgi:glutaconate CoA-transferase, subunit A
MGVPFTAVRGLFGTDLLKNRPDLKVIENPFNPGEEVVVVPAVRPDVAVLHALRADRWGNTAIPGLRDDLMMARAARLVVVTAEEISDAEVKPRAGEPETFLPAIDVDVVVHAPRGAHPTACGALYGQDAAHVKEYIAAAKEEKTFQAYLEKYITGAAGEPEYLERANVNDPRKKEKGNG